MSRVPTRSTRRGARAAAASPAVAGFRPAGAALAVAAAFAVQSGSLQAQSVPIGAIHGTATFARNGNNLLVTTTNGAGTNHSAINWQNFSVPGGSTTYFQQPSAASTSINRVLGPDPSAIFGTLGSNGKLVLVNPAGIAVGKGALVDTAGFTASTLGMSDADAIAGRMAFSGAGVGVLQVDGHVIARGGDVVLIGSKVQTGSEAVVQSDGAVVLAAGQKAEITGRGLEGIRLEVQTGDEAVNLGTLKGDAVGMFANTLTHSGLVQAQAVTSEGGRVVLKASGGDAIVSGTLVASAANGKGGSIDVLGERVGLMAGAQLQASGAMGGGQVRVGGDYQGQNAEVPNAKRVYFDAAARIEADATQQGDGGRVIVWSDEVTRMRGQISARGGAEGGNGGFAEVSGKQRLEYTGMTDLRAPGGAVGTLLLDPENVRIIRRDDGVPFTQTVNTFPGPGSSPFAGATFEPSSTGDVTLTDSHLNAQLAASNVRVTTSSTTSTGTGGQITVEADALVQWSSGTDLSLQADKGITILGRIQGVLPPPSPTPPPVPSLHLLAKGGNIDDGGGVGVIDVPELLASAIGGSVQLGGNHVVSRVAGAATGSFTFRSTQALTVDTVDTAAGARSDITAGGAVIVSAPTLTVSGDGFIKRTTVGDITLDVDGLSLLGATAAAAIDSPGRVVIRPFSPVPPPSPTPSPAPPVAIVGTGGIDIDGGINLHTPDLNKISAPTLVIGDGGMARDILLSGLVDLTTNNVQDLSLISANSISQASGSVLKVAGVNLDAPTVDVSNAGNQVGTVSGRYDDRFHFHSDSNLTIGMVDGISGVQIVTPTATAPDLIIGSDGVLTIAKNVTGSGVELEGDTVQMASSAQVSATQVSAGISSGLLEIDAYGTGTNNLAGTLNSDNLVRLEGYGTWTLGNVNSPSLQLVEGGTVSPVVFQQGAGALKVGGVSGSLSAAGSAVRFTNAANEIGSVSLDVNGVVKVTSSTDLDVSQVSGTEIQLKGANLYVGVESSVIGSGNVSLSGTGAGSTIDLSGGFVSAGNELSFGTAGDVVLGEVSTNKLSATISGSLTQDPFSSPSLDAPGGVVANVGGSIDLTGNLGYVSGSAGGSIVMNGVSGVAQAGLTAAGDISLSTQGPLLLLSAEFLAALVPPAPGDLDLIGSVDSTGGTVTLTSGNNILVQEGAVVSGTSLQMEAMQTQVYGTLQPGGDGGIGSASVAGDLFVGGAGAVMLDVSSVTSFDTLSVTGVASTDSTQALRLVDRTGGASTGSFTPTTLGSGSSLSFKLPAASWSVSSSLPYLVTIGAPVVAPAPPPSPLEEKLAADQNLNQIATFATLFIQESEAQQQEEAKDNAIGKDDIVVTETACTAR